MDGYQIFKWEQLARRQKLYVAAAGVVLLGFVIWVVADKYRSWAELREFENAAAEAKREKEAALEQAADVASQVQVREEELGKIEVKRDAKKGEIKNAVDRVARDRAEYDRAVRERRKDIPSTKQLCDELAALGHPCRP
jgi:hypothetical protein